MGAVVNPVKADEFIKTVYKCYEVPLSKSNSQKFIGFIDIDRIKDYVRKFTCYISHMTSKAGRTAREVGSLRYYKLDTWPGGRKPTKV